MIDQEKFRGRESAGSDPNKHQFRVGTVIAAVGNSVHLQGRRVVYEKGSGQPAMLGEEHIILLSKEDVLAVRQAEL